MKLVFLVLFSTIIYACHEPASTERQSNGREDLSKTPIDTNLKPNEIEYWVSIDYLRSLDKKLSICDCWRQTTFHLLNIDTNALEIIIHSNLFHAGMDTQETLPLIADRQMYVTDTSVAGYFKEPIRFEKPDSDTLEITMKKRKYKFVRRTFESSNTGRDSKLISRILLKYNTIDAKETTKILVPVDSLKKFILDGRVDAYCSDDYYHDGMAIRAKKPRYFHLEFKPGKVVLYEETNPRGRRQKINLTSLAKQTMIIGR